MTVSNAQFINKIEYLGYSFKRETKVTRVFKKGVRTIYVPKKRLADKWVKGQLRYAGLYSEEIRQFMGSCNA